MAVVPAQGTTTGTPHLPGASTKMSPPSPPAAPGMAPGSIVPAPATTAITKAAPAQAPASPAAPQQRLLQAGEQPAPGMVPATIGGQLYQVPVGGQQMSRGASMSGLTPEAQAADPLARGQMAFGGQNFNPFVSANYDPAVTAARNPNQPPPPLPMEDPASYKARVDAWRAFQGAGQAGSNVMPAPNMSAAVMPDRPGGGVPLDAPPPGWKPEMLINPVSQGSDMMRAAVMPDQAGAGTPLAPAPQTAQAMGLQGVAPAPSVTMAAPPGATPPPPPAPGVQPQPAQGQPVAPTVTPGPPPVAGAPVTNPNALPGQITPENTLINQRIGFDVNPDMVQARSLTDLVGQTMEGLTPAMDARLRESTLGLRDRTSAMGRTGAGLFDREFRDINARESADRQGLLADLGFRAGSTDVNNSLTADLSNQRIGAETQMARLSHLVGERGYERGLARDATADEADRLRFAGQGFQNDPTGATMDASRLNAMLAELFGGASREGGAAAGEGVQNILDLILGRPGAQGQAPAGGRPSGTDPRMTPQTGSVAVPGRTVPRPTPITLE